MLSSISSENLKKEEEIFLQICKCLDTKESLIFNAGAGAGKTYALIESLKYLVKKYNKQFSNHNQKAICITYTNVATAEVRERLGNSSMIMVSTIHERIWHFIHKYQNELVQIHKEKLEEELKLLNEKIETENTYNRYRNLSINEQQKFKSIMYEHKSLFNKYYSDSASNFRSAFQNLLTDFADLLRNINEFKSTVGALYKISNYEKCHEAIVQGHRDYKTVQYTSFYNTDQLHKMRISHDTLLEYGFKIIDRYDVLKQIIIDKYPFIFIDEYQDTDEYVINIMNVLQKYATLKSRSFFVGYFGDTAQSIYEQGVGKNITKIHKNLTIINKEFNRRSAKEVIDVSNKIRNDNIVQRSIYKDCKGGSVKFYTGTPEDTESFIEKYSKKWSATIEKPLHCFVLTNRIVAQYTGFEELYSVFSRAEIYRGLGFKQLNVEFMSNDLSKLGEVSILIFKIVSLINDVKDNTTFIKNIMPQRIYEGMNITELRELKILLSKINGNTFKECIESIIKIYSEDLQGKFQQIVHLIFDMKNVTIESFRNYLIERLFPNTDDENIETANSLINQLFDINMTVYTSWQKYILDSTIDKVINHTYHGTKGLEFKNVIIIMGNDFGTNRNFFSGYFKGSSNAEMLEEAKNLLYVSITRTIENLRILYIDDTEDFKVKIKEVFGEVYLYNPE